MNRTLTEEQILSEAEKLDISEKTATKTRSITALYPNMTIQDAYLIQNAWVNKLIQSGRKVSGHKVGLTSKVMQRAFGIDEPDFGVLLDNMVLRSGATIDVSQYLEPRIEVEIAFLLSDDLPAEGITIQKVIDSSEQIIPAMELIDFRAHGVDPENGSKRTVKDTIADNAANAAMILGNETIPPSTDLKWVGALLYKNGEIEQSGVAAAVLEHPANGVIWLAKKYAEFGRQLKAGQYVLAGSFTSPIPVAAGDIVCADFNSFGKVEVSFV